MHLRLALPIAVVFAATLAACAGEPDPVPEEVFGPGDGGSDVGPAETPDETAAATAAAAAADTAAPLPDGPAHGTGLAVALSGRSIVSQADGICRYFSGDGVLQVVEAGQPTRTGDWWVAVTDVDVCERVGEVALCRETTFGDDGTVTSAGSDTDPTVVGQLAEGNACI